MSPSRSQPTAGDALCKVAFVNITVAKVTPRTSCRSTTSSDSADSVTSFTPTMTSSSPDSDDEELLPSSTSTWTTYVYFYPRYDMTYTHCLLSTSRHIDCDDLYSTSACRPCFPGEDTVSADGCRPGRPNEEIVSPGVASRWRRRVNAARTPFWFPVARSYDTASPAYFYYPRHDLSYAEVEASRVDRQPGVDQSSLPFDTILEELADNATSLDDWSYVLEDRKSLIDDCSDILSVRRTQVPCSAVQDNLRSTTSSLSACQSDEELTQNMLTLTSPICCDNATAAINDAAEDSVSVSDHELTTSDRRVSHRCQTVDSILTPITKLDLKSLELVALRQRVDSGRARAGGRSPVADKVRVVVRRSASDPALRADGQQSPVRELPLSARVVKNRNQFSAADEEGVDDITADGDQACCSPHSVVPLRAKQALTCLLFDHQSTNNNAAELSPREPVSLVKTDATTSNEYISCPAHQSVASFATMSMSPIVAKEDQHHISNSDQTGNIAKMKDESLGREAVDVHSTLTDVVAWSVQAEITSQETTSPDATSQVADNLSVDWSSSSSEYLTPPTRRNPDSVTTSATATRVCDATSQTPLDTELYAAEVQTAHPENSELVAGSLVTQVCETISSTGDTDVRFSDIQRLHSSYLEEHELELCLSNLEQSNVVCDVTSMVPEEFVHQTKIAYLSSESVTVTDSVTHICDKTFSTVSAIDVQSVHLSYIEDSSIVTASPTITQISEAITPRVDTVVSTTKVHIAHSPVPEQNKSVTASATLTKVCDEISPAVDNGPIVSSTKVHAVHPSYLEQTETSGRDDKKHGRLADVTKVDRRHSEAVLRSSDLLLRQSLHKRHPSTSTLRESRIAPAYRQPNRRPNIERIGPDSLADVGGLTAYAAALTPRKQDASKRAAADHRVSGRSRTPSKSYVNMWRKRVATYEAFVNRCQTSTTTATGARSKYGAHFRF